MTRARLVQPATLGEAAATDDQDYLLLSGFNRPLRRLPTSVLESQIAADVTPEPIKCYQDRWDSGPISSSSTAIDSLQVDVTAAQAPCVVFVLWRSSCIMTVNASSNGVVEHTLEYGAAVQAQDFCRLDLSNVGAAVTVKNAAILTYQRPVSSASTLNFYVYANHNGNCSAVTSGDRQWQALVLPGASIA